jgi:CheY-like chemotaxis protein
VYEGSGLGLSIARELVQKLGGHISVESTENMGTTFTFTLAGSSRKLGADKPESVHKQLDKEASPLILVAEDDDFNFKYLDIILKRNGYLVQRAENGLEAVNYCRAHTDAVSLILMDMKMPVMGGLDATRQIRGFLTDLPIIALTAYVSVADENAAYDAGCDEFLSKPVNKEKLLGLMQQILSA